MGSSSHPNLFVVNAILRRHFPDAVIRWDTTGDPLAVTVTVDGTDVRAVIPVADLEEGGEVYHKFIGGLLGYLNKIRKKPEGAPRRGVEELFAA